MGQKLGQHFLNNDGILSEIAVSFPATFGDVVIEIGPGHGELTKFIYERVKNEHLSLTLIEKDATLFEQLNRKYSGSDVNIIYDDALVYIQNFLNSTEAEKAKHIIILGNIPYYITGHLLRIFGTAKRIPDNVSLVIQKEVAVRMASIEPKMNLLAASVQIWGTAKIVRIIKKTEFSPPPKIDSALISIQKICESVPAKYFDTVKLLFAHPRKTALNNISEIMKKSEASQLLKIINLPVTARPQDFSVQNIIMVSNMLYNDHT